LFQVGVNLSTCFLQETRDNPESISNFYLHSVCFTLPFFIPPFLQKKSIEQLFHDTLINQTTSGMSGEPSSNDIKASSWQGGNKASAPLNAASSKEGEEISTGSANGFSFPRSNAGGHKLRKGTLLVHLAYSVCTMKSERTSS